MLFPCHNLSCLVLEFVFAVACHPVVFVCKGTEKLPNCLQNIMLSVLRDSFSHRKKSEEAETMTKAYECFLPPGS